MQKLSQHFLKDQKVLERIAGAIDSDKVETIIEIGPGHGELTKRLKTHNLKLKTIAIERDRELAASLKENFANDSSVQIAEGDALKVLPEIVAGLEGEYAVIGNIPYYITGFLFRTLGSLPKKPKQIVLLIQKEVAERVVAEPPEMNRLAASVQFWGDPEIMLIVPPGAFSPPPKVHSAVIRIVPKVKKTSISEETYYKTVRLLFSQPRKTLLNNISSELSKKEVATVLEKLALNPQDRPQNLTVAQIMSLADALFPL